jgi:hypothetical protein
MTASVESNAIVTRPKGTAPPKASTKTTFKNWVCVCDKTCDEIATPDESTNDSVMVGVATATVPVPVPVPVEFPLLPVPPDGVPAFPPPPPQAASAKVRPNAAAYLRKFIRMVLSLVLEI